MSSRLLPAGAATEPLLWREANAGPAVEVAVALQQRESVPAAQSAPPIQEDQLTERRLAQLRAEAEQRAHQAHQRGFGEGEQAGKQRAATDLAGVMQRVAQTMGELAGARQKYRAEAEEDCVKLALAVARRVLMREINADPEALLGLVKAAFMKLDARETTRVRVHLDDVQILRQHLERLGMPPRLEIVGDRELERGSAVFETSRGNLDASVSTQLREIERGFTDRLRGT